ncbi:MAG: general secretion pathway protein GspK [Acidobacteria bacterium]|nr:general secretion pathway protein GspK [Acidobacteriota bacterium]
MAKRSQRQILEKTLADQRGVALLVVLWLAASLSVMAMATAYLVRTEVEAVRNQIEAQRGYYLARGGIEAAVYSIARAALPQTPGAESSGQAGEFRPGQRWLRFDFSGGSSVVEVVPENAKLNVNQASAEQLAVLFQTLGLAANESAQLAAAIVDWRSPQGSTVGSPFDSYYAGLPQPYAARHAPLENLEELLPVQGMSREVFFGRMEQGLQGEWQKWPPLADLLTTENTFGMVNLNYAPYEVLRTLPGWNEALATAVVAARAAAPFRSLEELQSAVPGLSSVLLLSPLTLSQGPVYTLRATGVLPGSGVRRSVRALLRIAPDLPLGHRVLAWWDDWPFAQEPPEGSRGSSGHDFSGAVTGPAEVRASAPEVSAWFASREERHTSAAKAARIRDAVAWTARLKPCPDEPCPDEKTETGSRS